MSTHAARGTNIDNLDATTWSNAASVMFSMDGLFRRLMTSLLLSASGSKVESSLHNFYITIPNIQAARVRFLDAELGLEATEFAGILKLYLFLLLAINESLDLRREGLLIGSGSLLVCVLQRFHREFRKSDIGITT